MRLYPFTLLVGHHCDRTLRARAGDTAVRRRVWHGDDEETVNFLRSEIRVRGAVRWADLRVFVRERKSRAAGEPVLPASPLAEEPAAAKDQVKTEVARRRPTEHQIAAEAEKLYAEPEYANDPPNLVKAERLLRERLPGATRPNIRAALKRPDIAELRRIRGRQPKRS
jgi:hypothetical protein